MRLNAPLSTALSSSFTASLAAHLRGTSRGLAAPCSAHALSSSASLFPAMAARKPRQATLAAFFSAPKRMRANGTSPPRRENPPAPAPPSLSADANLARVPDKNDCADPSNAGPTQQGTPADNEKILSSSRNNPARKNPAQSPPPTSPLGARPQPSIPAAGTQAGQFPPLRSLLREPSWAAALGREFEEPYMRQLQTFLDAEVSRNERVFPPAASVFEALNRCPMERARVVIIGQDPYHGPGQAVGLSFSVPRGVPLPSSLQNVFKEMRSDGSIDAMPSHGCLRHWADQGILLLNTVLTVRAHQANSHAKKGWEQFTDAAIRALASQRPKPKSSSSSSSSSPPLIFLLWGNHAKTKAKVIPAGSNVVLLSSAHPSGLSAHRGFFGSAHFSKVNSILRSHGQSPIQWSTE
ncbi:hypothetical protein CLOP_g25049 [Closterium sp. NIES-67]|nr:hypothetical protein CLOP_g25049 [Closterium sp. NIES-67]